MQADLNSAAVRRRKSKRFQVEGVYIEDLYIREECRGKGYGEALLREVCKLAKKRNCGRVEWWVLDWNKRAIDFYKKIGAIPMSEWTVFRLTESAITDLLSKKGAS